MRPRRVDAALGIGRRVRLGSWLWWRRGNGFPDLA
jgi:hypothetical protein